MKINALLYRNKHFIWGGFLTSLFLILQLYGKTMPYLVNITFLFCPFFFAGMYGKSSIQYIIRYINGRRWLSMSLFAFSFVLLILFYKFTPIVHTNAVVSFIPQFYLYWISGFIGITSMLFLCQCFSTKPNMVVTLISTATLFIMCSHYEIIQRVTSFLIRLNYGDIPSVIFVCVYFVIQCAIIPYILKWFPILAGRKRL